MTKARLDLSDKRILLTGASSGIGRALATELAGRGAHLALAARRGDLLDELATELGAPGKTPVTISTDLSVPGAARALAAEALAAFEGRVDIVVNNAGSSVTGAQVRLADGT